MFSLLFVFVFVSLLLAGVRGSSSPPFAVYTLTLGSTNQVNILSGNSTGEIEVVNKVNSGGNGIPNGPGLGSQHSLVVYQNYLFVVNTGSDSVSMFSIDPTDPTQITLISTQPAGFNWPLSLTVWGSWVCVASSGASNGLRCFSFTSAGLTVMSSWDRSFGLNLTTPPAFHTGPAQISFMPDGSGLVVSIKSNNPPLMLYTISNSQLSSAPTSTPSFGNIPFGFTFDINAETSFVLTDPAPTSAGLSGVGIVTVATGSSPSITTVASYTLIPNQHAACWIEQSTISGHFFVANAASENISEVSRSGSTLTIVNSYPVTSSETDMAIAKIGSTEYLFAQSGGNVVFVFSLAGGSGGAQLIQTANLQPTGSYGAGVAVYVGQSTASFLSIFAVMVVLL